MAEAQFVHGDPVMIDYTPTGGDVTAGTVVVVGQIPAVAHLAITNNTLGSLAAMGGVYDVTALSNYAAGTRVYWDDTNNKVTTTSTNNTPFGTTVEAAAAANTVVEVLHHPFTAA